MLTVSDSIKQAYNQYTTQRKSYIQVGNNSFFIQNLDVSADAYYEGNVIGNAIAKIARFDIETVNVNGIDEFELFDGIWTGNQYEYVSLGTFKLFNEEGADDFFSSITAYDKLIHFNKEYDPSLTTYPTTLYGLLQNICSQAGVELENTSIPNGNQPLPSNLFVENETLKNILNAICQINGYFGIISKDKLKLLLKGIETINLNKYQLSNPEYKRTTWKINQVVLGMKDVEGEYVLRQDDKDIEQNGIHKLVINDNPFVYRQDLREAYIDNLFNQVKGFGYTAFETTWEGLSYVELGDLINIDGKESIVLRYNLKSPQGLNSTLSAPSIIDSVVDYVDNSNSIKNQQKRTEFWVDKQLGQIKGEVVNIETTVENITTTTQTSTGPNELYITDSLESNALEYCIEGKCEQNGTPTPDSPSEIKTVPSIRNLFDASLFEEFTGDFKYIDLQLKPNTKYTMTSNMPRSSNNYGNLFFYSTNSSASTGLSDVTIGISRTITTTDDGIGRIAYRDSLSEYSNETIDYWYTIVEGPIDYGYIPYGSWAKIKTTDNIFKNNFENKTISSDGSIANSTNRIKTIDFIGVNSNTTYKLEVNTNDSKKLQVYVFEYKEDGTFIQRIGSSWNTLPYEFTTSPDTKNIHLLLSYTDATTIGITDITNGLLYTKENEVLIDLSKPNLFDKDNTNELSMYVNGGTKKYISSNSAHSVYIECKPNTTYMIKRTNNNTNDYGLASSVNIPTAGEDVSNYVDTQDNSNLFITTGTNDKYLFIYYQWGDYTTYTKNEVLSGIKIYEGYEDYYELRSIEDTKDTHEVVSGTLTKKIGKLVLDGSEDIYSTGNVQTNTTQFGVNLSVTMGNQFGLCTHFPISKDWDDSTHIVWNPNATRLYIYFPLSIATTVDELKNWLSENNVEIYYPLPEIEQITLSNVNIPLFNGINHITLVDDLETTTSIKYLRNTPISSEYATNQQLDITNSNLSETTTKTNQNVTDIDETNANLNNNYYNKEQIDAMNTSTEQIITEIRNEVETTTTATDLQISIIQEQLTNGVTSVRTETGYTFDKDGLKIQKEDSEMSSVLDNDGLAVKRNEEEVLTVRSSGVETENLKVRTYFTIGNNTRVEDYKGGTGFFYIGGGN